MTSPLSIPVITQVQPSGDLLTADNVQVDLSHADIGDNAAIHMRWGAYDLQSKTISQTTVPLNGPSATFPIPANQICDGKVTVWYSVQDNIGNKSYSDILVQNVTTGTRLLTAPSATAVSNSNPRNFYATIPNNPNFGLTLQAKDTVVVSWTLYKDGQAINGPYSQSFLVSEAFSSGYKTSPLTPAPEGEQYMRLSYTIERSIPFGTNGTSDPDSTQLALSQSETIFGYDLWPTSPTLLPAPTFPEADASNVLHIDTQNGHYASVGIPATTAIPPNSMVTFTGQGFTPISNQRIASADWNSGLLTVQNTPYTNTNAIPLATLQAVPDGGTYTIQYIVNSQTSPSTSVTITQGTPPLVDNLPKPYFPAALNDVLTLTPASSTNEAQLIMINDKTWSLSGQRLFFFGEGVNHNNSIPAAHWESGVVIANKSPVQMIHIPRSYLEQVNAGGSYTIYYRVGDPNHGAQSPSTTVLLRFPLGT